MPKKSTCLAKAGRRRILYIITKSVWGGAAKYVYDLAFNLAEENFDVFVASNGQGELAQRIQRANIPYFEIKNFQRKVNIFKDIIAGYEIFSLLLKVKPDIVHVNSSKAGGLAGLAVWLYKLFGRQIHLVFTAHGWAFAETRPFWQIQLIKFLSKITVLFYDQVICVSEHDRKIALAYKIAPADKLFTIHNGLNFKAISFFDRHKAQAKLLGRNSNLVIGSIAEWTKNKGLIYLLEALIKIKPLDKLDIILIGSGENPDKKIIQQFITNHKLNNICLLEYVPQAANYLKAFDIFVLPSIKEGLPYTILEAMAAQVPVIATPVGGIPEMIINNQTGFLVPTKNSQELAAKIVHLLNHQDMTKNITKNAEIKACQEFGLDKMIQKTASLYVNTQHRFSP